MNQTAEILGKEKNKFIHYKALDGLRTYATLAVFLKHIFGNIIVKPSPNILTDTILCMTDVSFIFMILSGFSISCGYYDRIKSGAITPNNFYKKRYKRILPFFVLLCLIDLAATPTMDNLFNLFANVTLCFNFIPNANITMIGVGWFLGTLFVFYLLYPFFVFMLDNKKRAWVSFFIAVVFAGVCSLYSFNPEIEESSLNRTNIILVMPLFMAGGIVFLYKDKLQLSGVKQYLCLATAIALTVGYFFLPNLDDVPFMRMIGETFVYSAWLIYALGSKDIILSNKFTKFIDGISMEIYLSHMFLFRIVEKIHLENYISDNNVLFLVTCVFVLILTIAFSYIVKRKIFPSIKFLN